MGLNDWIEKAAAGEGSRGGNVIGHTASGKPIYGEGHKYGQEINVHTLVMKQHKTKGEDKAAAAHQAAIDAHHAVHEKKGTKGHRERRKAAKNATTEAHAHTWESIGDPEAARRLRAKIKKSEVGMDLQDWIEKAEPTIEPQGSEAVDMLEGWLEKASKKKLPSEEAKVAPEKARQILHDGQVRGQALTGQQRKFFGAIGGHLPAPKTKKSEASVGIGDWIEKAAAGEGSRGGKVVGHTQSGKPIYAAKHPHYRGEAKTHQGYHAMGYSDLDHRDARDHHAALAAKHERSKSEKRRQKGREHNTAAAFHGAAQERAEEHPEHAERRAKYADAVYGAGSPHAEAARVKKSKRPETKKSEEHMSAFKFGIPIRKSGDYVEEDLAKKKAKQSPGKMGEGNYPMPPTANIAKDNKKSKKRGDGGKGSGGMPSGNPPAKMPTSGRVQEGSIPGITKAELEAATIIAEALRIRKGQNPDVVAGVAGLPPMPVDTRARLHALQNRGAVVYTGIESRQDVFSPHQPQSHNHGDLGKSRTCRLCKSATPAALTSCTCCGLDLSGRFVSTAGGAQVEKSIIASLERDDDDVIAG